MNIPSEFTHSLQAESVGQGNLMEARNRRKESLKSTHLHILSALNKSWRCSLTRLAALNTAKPNLFALITNGENVARYLQVNVCVSMNGGQTAG